MPAMIDLPGLQMHYRDSGTDGRPVLLLHGWPQTGACWDALAPLLSEDHRCIAPDLRGYGLTDKPVGDYTKRTMAHDAVHLLDALGIERVHVVGHDRGARVAHRMALDHAERVITLTVLDVSPTHAMFATGTPQTSLAYFHWYFHMQPYLPELLVGDRIEEYLRYFFERWTFRRDALQDKIPDYVHAFEQPGALTAGFEDYRATMTDVEHDEADVAAGRLVQAPTLALWGEHSLAASTPVLDNWRRYALDVRGHAIPDCGHFVPEEAAQTVADEVRAFWGDQTHAT